MPTAITTEHFLARSSHPTSSQRWRQQHSTGTVPQDLGSDGNEVEEEQARSWASVEYHDEFNGRLLRVSGIDRDSLVPVIRELQRSQGYQAPAWAQQVAPAYPPEGPQNPEYRLAGPQFSTPPPHQQQQQQYQPPPQQQQPQWLAQEQSLGQLAYSLGMQFLQQGLPFAYPPQVPQGSLQQPPQDLGCRPAGRQFSTAPRQWEQQQQYQPPPQPHQQQQPQRPAQEQWPGEFAYRQGMQHLQQRSPSAQGMQHLNIDSNASSDNSEGGSKTDSARMTGFDVGITATAVGGARMSVNHSAPQGAAPVLPQDQNFTPFNQEPPPSPSPNAPSSRGPTPPPAFTPAGQSAPHLASQRGGSPQPPPVRSATPRKQPPPPLATVSGQENLLDVPSRVTGLSSLAVHLHNDDNPPRSPVGSGGDDIDISSINGSSLTLPVKTGKKQRKHRKMFSFLAPKKK